MANVSYTNIHSQPEKVILAAEDEVLIVDSEDSWKRKRVLVSSMGSGSIPGPQGPQGIQGPAGADGVDGQNGAQGVPGSANIENIAYTYSGDFVATMTIGARTITYSNDGSVYTSWTDSIYTWTPTYNATTGLLESVTVTTN
jgi:hypothetical protein